MDVERIQKLAECEERLGWSFRDKQLLERALTHRSFVNENPALAIGDNERLEFLGDAVLQLIVSDLSMKMFPDYSEGHLSKLRASVVNEQPLAELSGSFAIGEYLQLGKGEEASGGRMKTSLLANAFESIVASIFLDGGYERTFVFLSPVFEPLLKKADADAAFNDYKTSLQERSMLLFKKIPRYTLIAETGPDHDKLFEMALFIGEKLVAKGSGKSKKEAEKQAARAALEELDGKREEMVP